MGGLSVLLVILGMIYGACMGCFAMTKDVGPSYQQFSASILKVPALYLLTLAVKVAPAANRTRVEINIAWTRKTGTAANAHHVTAYLAPTA